MLNGRLEVMAVHPRYLQLANKFNSGGAKLFLFL
jgi:hypothetical protein